MKIPTFDSLRSSPINQETQQAMNNAILEFNTMLTSGVLPPEKDEWKKLEEHLAQHPPKNPPLVPLSKEADAIFETCLALAKIMEEVSVGKWTSLLAPFKRALSGNVVNKSQFRIAVMQVASQRLRYVGVNAPLVNDRPTSRIPPDDWQPGNSAVT